MQPFVGEWIEQGSTRGASPIDLGLITFEWALRGRFLLMRTERNHPDIPENAALIGDDAHEDDYSVHYFDSLGMKRIYRMTFRDRTWTMSRHEPDFAVPEFAQRFLGTFADDYNSIEGAWQTSDDGVTWDHDFGLLYTRVR